MADKIKDTGKSARRIVVKDKPKPLIDPFELAERLGADVVIEAPNFGGGPMGVMAAGHWIAERHRKMREAAKEAKLNTSDHVRLWIKGSEMSIAGRVRGFHFPEGGTVVTLDCVDGKTREIRLEDIEKSANFGSLWPKEQRPKFGRPKRRPSRKRKR